MDCSEGNRRSSRLVKDMLLMAITMTMAFVVGFTSVWLLLFWRSFMFPISVMTLLSAPRRLPIVDDLLSTMRHFESVQVFADDLKRKYCPIIVTLSWASSKPVVIISGPDEETFEGRTHLSSKRILHLTNRGRTSGHSDRDRFLRRKLVRSEILSKKRAAMGFSRPIRDREVKILSERLKKRKQQVGCDSERGMSTVFARRLTVIEDYYTIELDEVMVQRFQMRVSKPRDFDIPFKRRLPLGEKSSEIFEPVIEETKETLQSGKTEELAPFVNTLLGLQSGEIFVISTKVNGLQYCGFLML